MDQVVAPAATWMARGFDDPVAASQLVFRGLMDALSRPGRIVDLHAPPAFPGPLDAGSAAITLALLDFETRLFLPEGCAAAGSWLRFHTGCRLTRGPEDADFVLVPRGHDCPDLARIRQGTDEAPHLSAMLIVAVEALGAGTRFRLTGPGIDGQTWLAIEGLSPGLVAQRHTLAQAFPRGIDLVLTCGAHATALPRTTRMEG